MATRSNAKRKRRSRPLYRGAKISDYRFRKVLMSFVLDDTIAEASRKTGLSTNSVAAIFRKLRVFFYEVGLFTDIYEGAHPVEAEIDDPEFELALLEFHFRRVHDKRGLDGTFDEPDYHLAESHWRLNYDLLTRHRPSGEIHSMMFNHLLEIIRLCGPVGAKSVNRQAGVMARLRQLDQRLAWLERNSPDFRSEEHRRELRAIREL